MNALGNFHKNVMNTFDAIFIITLTISMPFKQYAHRPLARNAPPPTPTPSVTVEPRSAFARPATPCLGQATSVLVAVSILLYFKMQHGLLLGLTKVVR